MRQKSAAPVPPPPPPKKPAPKRPARKPVKAVVVHRPQPDYFINPEGKPCSCYSCRQAKLAEEYVASTKARKMRPDGDPEHVNGRKFEPTPQERQQAMLMAATGYTMKQACRQIRLTDGGICQPTFSKHFAEEWATGADKVNMAVAANLFNIATSPTHKASHIAAIFWVKTRMRWADNPKQAVEIEQIMEDRAKQRAGGSADHIIIELDMGEPKTK